MTESLLVDEVPEARFGRVEPALEQLRAGNAVVVVDERGEGGLVFAACLADACAHWPPHPDDLHPMHHLASLSAE